MIINIYIYIYIYIYIIYSERKMINNINYITNVYYLPSEYDWHRLRYNVIDINDVIS